MLLTGRYDCVVDAKNRVSIPFSIRKMLSAAEDGKAYYALPGRRTGTISIYPDRYYERTIRPPMPAGTELSDPAYEWLQFECGQTATLEEDSQGRVLIPEWLLKRAGIEKEATLIGVRDHMELWDRKTYESFLNRLWPTYSDLRASTADELARVAAAAGKSAPQGSPGVEAPQRVDQT